MVCGTRLHSLDLDSPLNEGSNGFVAGARVGDQDIDIGYGADEGGAYYSQFGRIRHHNSQLGLADHGAKREALFRLNDGYSALNPNPASAQEDLIHVNVV